MKKSPLDEWIEKKHQVSMTNRKELEEWQLNCINRIIAYAKDNSSFYHNHLEGVDVLSCLANIEKVPLMDSNSLRENSSSLICVPQNDITRGFSLYTSGTTDLPKQVYFTEADQILTIDFFQKNLNAYAHKGEIVCIFLPASRSGCVCDLLCKGFLCQGIHAIPYGLINNVEEAAQRIYKSQASILIGIPTQILALAEYCRVKNIKTNVKYVLLSTDYAAKVLIQRVSQIWDCEVFNHYGMTEMGFGAAIECQAHNGMHIRENDLYFEVINPETGKILKTGEEGELVFTTLTRTGMPLIRYRTGDTGILNEELCQCGSILKRIKKVGARIGQGIMTKDGYITIDVLDEIIFSMNCVIDYQLYVAENNHLKCKIYTIDSYDISDLQELGNIETSIVCLGKELLPYIGKRKLFTN